MRIKIGKYKNWFGPYQLADALCFWVKDIKDEFGIKGKPDWVQKFGEWLAHGKVEPDPVVGQISSWDRNTTLLYTFLMWIDSKKKRKIKVHIDRWDTWSMDHTLAIIILPMLKQLRDTKHGSQIVDDEDVPPHLRGNKYNHWDDQLSFEFYKEDNDDDLVHKRWDWVLNEMIWAFEEHNDDNADEKFWVDVATKEMQWEYTENGTYKLLSHEDEKKPSYDAVGLQGWNERKQNGFRLFGKYYTGLWD